jgi:hypothetical protein
MHNQQQDVNEMLLTELRIGAEIGNLLAISEDVTENKASYRLLSVSGCKTTSLKNKELLSFFSRKKGGPKICRYIRGCV